MSTLVNVKPLKLKGECISYPLINTNVRHDCIDELLVQIAHKTNEETTTLRYVLAEYHPNYQNIIKNYNKKKMEELQYLIIIQCELQKYQFTHCDITSTTFRLLPEDEIEGKSVGWITGSTFNPIDGIVLPDITKIEQAYNWKVCREDSSCQNDHSKLTDLKQKHYHKLNVKYQQTINM